jgi:hypothetical protein
MPRQAGPAEWQWLADTLTEYFPWLGSDDPVSGAECIQAVNELYNEAWKRAGNSNPVRPADEVEVRS